MGTRWGHASGARRIHEMCPLALVGIRSLCQEERDYLRQNSVPAFFWPPDDDDSYVREVVAHLGPNVYISVDLDAFDPSLMAAVGTPEPGGMTWHQVTSLLRTVAESRRIIGFDVSELAPREGPLACSYTAAKLVYKLVAYATFRPTKEINTLSWPYQGPSTSSGRTD
jgi:agmatinase